MDVPVRFGAGLSDLIGRSQVVLDLPSEATVADLLTVLQDSYPSLSSRATRALTVVDGRQVGRARALSEGEQVSLLLPAAGG